MRGRIVLLVVVLALGVGVPAALSGAAGVLRVYHALLLAWVMVPLGALLLLGVGRLAGGAWSRAAAPLLEAAARLVPVTGLLFLPVVLGLDLLFPWARPGWEGEGGKAAWLSEGFFVARMVGYFVAWTVAAVLLRRGGRPGAVVALVVLMLTGSLAGVDWLMTLDPAFNSSVFGLWVLAQAVLAALAVAALVNGRGEGWKSLASVLLAAVLLWGYLAFVQYLVIWSGDLPHLVSWYLDRGAGWWGVLVWVVGLGHLTALAILTLPARRHPPTLLATAAALLVLRVAETVWLVGPGV